MDLEKQFFFIILLVILIILSNIFFYTESFELNSDVSILNLVSINS